MAEAMRLLHRLERRLAAAEIGRIAITTSDPDDEKKIFELINNAGSPLTAVEIMSARPEWNELVETSDAKITQAVNGLFSEMDIARSSNAKPRRWDVAATLIDRMNAPVLFDRIRDEATAGSFERRITLGFQLYAGWRLHGISKKHIERIPSAALHWGDDELRGDLEKLSAELAKIAVFQRLSEWGHSIRSLTSEAVALDFLSTALGGVAPKRESNESSGRRMDRVQNRGCPSVRSSCLGIRHSRVARSKRLASSG